MPCKHKFYDYLNLEKIDFEPETLIIGTFNPEWPDTNTAQWFYGRIANNYFGEVLPRLHDKDSLLKPTPEEWKQFCSNEKIAITDLIGCIADADERNADHIELLRGYSDRAIAKSFINFEKVDIVAILKKYPTVKDVYLTQSGREKFWRICWQPIQQYCKENTISCTTLLTPSRYARYQQSKYNKANSSTPLALADYVLMRWKEKWH